MPTVGRIDAPHYNPLPVYAHSSEEDGIPLIAFYEMLSAEQRRQINRPLQPRGDA